jgi:hypothetical protein
VDEVVSVVVEMHGHEDVVVEGKLEMVVVEGVVDDGDSGGGDGDGSRVE